MGVTSCLGHVFSVTWYGTRSYDGMGCSAVATVALLQAQPPVASALNTVELPPSQLSYAYKLTWSFGICPHQARAVELRTAHIPVITDQSIIYQIDWQPLGLSAPVCHCLLVAAPVYRLQCLLAVCLKGCMPQP